MDLTIVEDPSLDSPVAAPSPCEADIQDCDSHEDSSDTEDEPTAWKRR